MTRIALFAGSFDPITIGHADVVQRSTKLFDKVIVAIGVNSTKKYLFPLEQRLDWLRKTFTGLPVEVSSFEGLTVEYCKKVGATHLLRGLRQAGDFEYEKTIAQLNMAIAGIETIFMVSRPEFSHISSTIVREIVTNGGDVSAFVPAAVRIEDRRIE